MKAAVATVDISDEELLKIVEEQPRLEDMNLVEEITVKKPKVIQERKEYNVAVLDCGVKKSILDRCFTIICFCSRYS